MNRKAFIVLGAIVALLVAVGVVTVVAHGGGTAHSVALPRSMASAGDSITRAFDVDQGHFLQDAPAESWATGTDPTVRSQYDRILAAVPAVAGHVFNDAHSGARMSALPGQLRAAAAAHVDYLSVLMGANDLCTPTVATMTPTATFEAELRQALTQFFAADPGAHVLVVSVPDLFQLWSALHTNPKAEAVWSLGHICAALLSPQATVADRAAVAAQELTDNVVLEKVCRGFLNCRFDRLAVYRANFGPAEISTVDYFHPSLAGQQRLAALSWAAGYWPSTA